MTGSALDAGRCFGYMLLGEKNRVGVQGEGSCREWSLAGGLADTCNRCFQVPSKVLVWDGVVLLLEGVLEGGLDASWRSLGN